QGWAETATGAVKYANGAKVKNLAMNGGTKNLYAIWKGTEYTVQFHKYDGSGATQNQTFKVGETKSLLWLDSQLKWSREGYEFIGWVPWNPDSKPRLCKYVNGQKVKDLAKPGETVHLWCGWKSASSYRVCFNKNDGSGLKMNQVILRNKEDSLAWMDSQIGWKRDGYTFQGWAETASGAVKYANGAKVKNLAMNGGTKNLYAVWKSTKTSAKCAAQDVGSQGLSDMPGMVVEGELADGSGVFCLVVGDDGAAVLYLGDGEGWAEEKCEVEPDGDEIAVSIDGEEAYRVTFDGDVPQLL
ncbi:MAG: InlB B-repeat-containing protein, partial [Kiritimatiellae bacterium]|nr:InlB B-repeat-containing protein [Kiritimatiellia bacterium]